ncbi:MAG: hypothetical protein H7A55_09570 [Verrucomicrobiaceae bacterium]|nr:hypothetical protein [Verrucomicrobiaceae bacterium]
MLGDDAIGVTGVESLVIEDGKKKRCFGRCEPAAAEEPACRADDCGDAMPAIAGSAPDLPEDAEVWRSVKDEGRSGKWEVWVLVLVLRLRI